MVKFLKCSVLLCLLFQEKPSFSQGPNFLWADSLPASPLYEKLIANDAAGNVFVCGRFNNSPDFDPGPSVYTLSATMGNVFVLKLDVNGNFLWAKNFGNAIPFSYTVDAGGNSLIGGQIQNTCDFDPGPGTFSSAPTGTANGFISRLDAAGVFVWAVTIDGSATNAVYDVTFDQGGDIYFTGSFEGTIDMDPSPSNFTLAAAGLSDVNIGRLNISGGFVWGKRIGGTNMDVGRKIRVDSSLPGTCFITGTYVDIVDFDPGPATYTLSGQLGNPQNPFFLKLNAQGNFLFAGDFPGSTGTSYLSSLSTFSNGIVCLAGAFTGTMDADPGVGVNVISGVGQGDGFIIQLDYSSNLSWVKTFSCSNVNDGMGCNVVATSSGRIISYGAFEGVVDFDPGPAVLNFTSAGGTDIFMMELNASGDLQWVKSIGTPTVDLPKSFSIDQNNNIYGTGQYAGTIDLDPGPSTFTFFTPGNGGGPNWGNYILKLGGGGIGFAENSLIPSAPTLYPVPVNDKFFIKNYFSDSVDISICDMNGKELITKLQFSSSEGIDLSCLPSNVYVAIIKCKNTSYSIKLIKQ